MDNDKRVNRSNGIKQPRAALVVGDPADARKNLGDRLAAVGFEISYANDGLAAYDAFLWHPVEIIVTDRQLPRLNGLGLVRRLREVSDVPIMMITASGSISDCEEAMRVGVDRYLQFGCDLDRVGEIARELLQLHAARRLARERSDSAPVPPTSSTSLSSPSELGGFGFESGRWTASEVRSLARREFRADLQRHLFECRGNMAEMARRMGKDRSTIRYHLRRLEMLEPRADESGHDFPHADHARWRTNVETDPL